MKYLILLSLAFAARPTRTFQVWTDVSDNNKIKISAFAFRHENFICLAPKDTEGNHVVFPEDLDIARDNCVFNPAKRAARLQAEIDKRNAEQTKRDALKLIAKELQDYDEDPAKWDGAQSMIRRIIPLLKAQNPDLFPR